MLNDYPLWLDWQGTIIYRQSSYDCFLDNEKDILRNKKYIVVPDSLYIWLVNEFNKVAINPMRVSIIDGHSKEKTRLATL